MTTRSEATTAACPLDPLVRHLSPDVTVYRDDCRDVLKIDADAVISDPPYGMSLNTDNSRFSGGHAASVARRGNGTADGRPILHDDEPFDPAPWLDYERVVLWGVNHFGSRVPVGTTLVWLKRNDQAFGSFLSDAEIAWMKAGMGFIASVLDAERRDGNQGPPHTKARAANGMVHGESKGAGRRSSARSVYGQRDDWNSLYPYWQKIYRH